MKTENEIENKYDDNHDGNLVSLEKKSKENNILGHCGCGYCFLICMLIFTMIMFIYCLSTKCLPGMENGTNVSETSLWFHIWKNLIIPIWAGLFSAIVYIIVAHHDQITLLKLLVLVIIASLIIVIPLWGGHVAKAKWLSPETNQVLLFTFFSCLITALTTRCLFGIIDKHDREKHNSKRD